MHSGCKCHFSSRNQYISGTESNWRKPKPLTDESRHSRSWKHPQYHTMVGKSFDNDSSCATEQRFSVFGNFLKCKNKQDSGKMEAGLSSSCDMSYNLPAPQKVPCSWSVEKEAAMNSNRANVPQIKTALQDNLVGLTCPTVIKCFPTVVGFCCKVHEGPSLSAAQASRSPPRVNPCPSSPLQSYASVLKRPHHHPSEPSKREVPKACYSLTALLKPGSNGSKCGTMEVKHPDSASPRAQKAKPARFSELKELVGMAGSPKSNVLQEGPAAIVLPHQGHASAGPLTCLVGELCFSKLPSPKVSPVKLNTEIAVSPKCGNALVAFVMGSGYPSADEGEEDDDGDWSFYGYDEQPENQNEVGSRKNPEEPKVEDDLMTLEEWLADGVVDVDPSSGRLAEVNRKWLEMYGSLTDCDFSSDDENDEDDDSDWDDSSGDEQPEVQVPPPRTCSSYQTSPLKKVSFASDDCLKVVHEFEPYDTKGPWEEIARDRCRFDTRKDKLSLVIGPILGSEHRDMVYRTRILPWIMQQDCDN